MSDLFFQASDFISARVDLPIIQNVEDLIYTETSEKDAYGHWLFGGSADSLVDKANGHLLQLQPSATVAPTYSTNAVTLGGTGNALLSDLVAQATTDLTMSAVVKLSTPSLAIIMGNLRNTSDVSSSTQGIFASSNKGYLTVKPLTASASGGANSITTNNNIDQSKYFFISASINKISKQYVLYVEQMGAANISGSFSSNFENSNNTIAIGNAYYGGATNTITFAEAILHNKALTLGEIQGVASRAKVRSAYRGIVF